MPALRILFANYTGQRGPIPAMAVQRRVTTIYSLSHAARFCTCVEYYVLAVLRAASI